MNRRAIAYFLGQILRVEGLFMLPALGIALYEGHRSSILGFLITAALLLILGSILVRLRDQTGKGIYAREGFVTVALGWILISLFGALPFFISGATPAFIDAWFETVSGFTTTGATIFSAVEDLPKSILYWRSFTHWLGGMGILVFMLAIVPASKGSGEGFHLLRAESPGPQVGKLVPTMRASARILYAIYIGMTLLMIVLLLVGGMPLFDSITTAYATAGTGGFSITNNSIMAYDSHYLQGVVAVFMALFGINFTLFYLLLLREWKAVFRNEELLTYIGVLALPTIAITINILPLYGNNFLESLHHAFFQVSSIATTTGFASADFNAWPEFSRMMLVLLMVIGACAGSTAGGLKVSRVVILVKAIKNELAKLLHPRSVKVLRMDGKALEENVVHGVHAYLAVYCLICFVSMLLVSADNFDFTTSVTAVLACFNNVGPGLSQVGPMGNFGGFSPFGKLVLSADMLLGRLEIFPLVLLFSPSVWKKGK